MTDRTVPAETADDRLRLGIGLRAEGDHEAAIVAFRAALTLNPNLAEAHHQLGNALKSLRRYREAVVSLRAAALLAPRSGAVWLNLGVALLELRRLEEAAAAFEEAVRLEPARPEARNILGHALLALGRCAEAGRVLEDALRLKPGYAAAHDNLGRVLKAQGRSAEAIVHHRAALGADPRPQVHSNLLYSLNFPAGVEPAGIAAEHRGWAGRHAAPLHASWKPWSGDRSASRRLRVGYVSPDLVRHSVAYFLEPVLASHDREGVEVFCYSDAAVADDMTERLRARAGNWRDVAGCPDEAVAERVREDRIDILVDLAGHTARNRLLVFARKPAPVQVTWLGYPNTTGLDAIDFRITDSVSDPPGRTESLHSERLVRLPGVFSCYGPRPESPPVGPPPALAAGQVTFGCFNHLAKLTPPAVDLWSRLLRELGTARLLLKSRGLVDPETAAAVRGEFERRGVDGARIALDGDELSVADHLALYGRVDIALDTFPYNGATTTCEALWMGVPVVTLAGQTHVSRVGASMLTHLGRPEWVAASPEDYVKCCRMLAADLSALAEIRRRLRDEMRQSPLCDAPRFTRHLEEAYRRMWLARVA